MWVLFQVFRHAKSTTKIPFFVYFIGIVLFGLGVRLLLNYYFPVFSLSQFDGVSLSAHMTKQKIRWGAIHHAVNQKDSATLKLLLEQGACVDECDCYGRTSLHHAALYGFVEGVQLLLAYRAGVNKKDQQGRTPLHLAAGKHGLLWADQKKYGQIIALLLHAGAQGDVCDKKGRTPLHYACMNGHAHLVNCLMRWGVELEVRDCFYATPLHYAAGKNGMLINDKRDYFTISAQLIACGASVNLVDQVGKNPLHYASACGHDLLGKLLVKQGVNIHKQDVMGATPLHYACGKDSLFFMPRKYAPHVKTSVQIKAHKKKYEREEKTHVALVAFLMKQGALTTIKDVEQKTPADYANHFQHFKIQEEIKKRELKR